MSEENENIENFLRKGLTGKEFQFREEDWAKLEPRLNAEFPTTPTGAMSTAKWIGLTAFLVGISFFSGWFLNSRLANTHSPAGSAAGEQLEKPTKGEDHTSATNNAKAAVAEKQTSGQTNGEIAQAHSYEDSATGARASSDTFMTEKRKGGAEELRKTSPGVEGKSQVFVSPGIKSDRILIRIKQLVGKQLELRRVLSPAPIPSDAHSVQVSTVQPAVVPGNTPTHYRLALGAAVSPDFSSTTPAPRFNEIGKAYGLLVEFQPFRKWRFSTGVFKADKVYSAGEGDYSPPLYGGWPDGVEPSHTDAACDVLDIPLTAAFQFVQFGPKSSIWLNGGISSYWMLTERYNYHYPNYDGYRLAGWQGENENSHVFGVVTLSASFETFVSERISVRVEPYFKMPLDGVGYGKVKLFTSGSWLTVRYHFLRNSGKTSVP